MRRCSLAQLRLRGRPAVDMMPHMVALLDPVFSLGLCPELTTALAEVCLAMPAPPPCPVPVALNLVPPWSCIWDPRGWLNVSHYLCIYVYASPAPRLVPVGLNFASRKSCHPDTVFYRCIFISLLCLPNLCSEKGGCLACVRVGGYSWERGLRAEDVRA